jgi:hypothetical protein
MGMNTGHPIVTDALKVKRVLPSRVIFQGECGERFNISIDEWPKLRSMVNKAIQAAKRKGQDALIELPEPV